MHKNNIYIYILVQGLCCCCCCSAQLLCSFAPLTNKFKFNKLSWLRTDSLERIENVFKIKLMLIVIAKLWRTQMPVHIELQWGNLSPIDAEMSTEMSWQFARSWTTARSSGGGGLKCSILTTRGSCEAGLPACLPVCLSACYIWWLSSICPGNRNWKATTNSLTRA